MTRSTVKKIAPVQRKKNILSVKVSITNLKNFKFICKYINELIITAESSN